MARKSSRQPTPAELRILSLLWRLGPSRLGQIVTELNRERQVANTTVATVLKVMLTKKLVERKTREGTTRWFARITRQSARKRLLNRLIATAFDGSAHSLVANLVEHGQLSEEDKRAIRELIDGPRLPGPSSTRTKRSDS